MAERKGLFPNDSKNMTKIEKAILCLKSGGVQVDPIKKVQVWTMGAPVNTSMVKAGGFLDSLMIGDGKEMKPEWRTKWVHSRTCVCPDCSEHTLASIKKSLPVQKKADGAWIKGKPPVPLPKEA
jgi:hypothetical protein